MEINLLLDREDSQGDEQGGQRNDGQVEVEAGQDPLVNCRVTGGVLK
jgi:hypothetical protein